MIGGIIFIYGSVYLTGSGSQLPRFFLFLIAVVRGDFLINHLHFLIKSGN